MKVMRLIALAMGVCSMISIARSDTVTLKNGDRLTGTIELSDGKDVTLKTDYAGEIKVHLSSIREMKTD